MSGRRREGLTPTLLPFMAVLICTLGTLILMLALVAQRAGKIVDTSRPTSAAEVAGGQSANAASSEAVQPVSLTQRFQQAQQWEREIGEAVWHRQQTMEIRAQQTAELEQQRDQLAHLEDHLRRLRQQLESLDTEVNAALDESPQHDEPHDPQTQLAQLLAAIESEKAALAQLQADRQKTPPRIVIVPYEGPNGTQRRPIYIECLGHGVVVQPGNIVIDREHLEPLPGLPNPLEAALRTIRLHAAQVDGDSLAPYPLLIVRPEGIQAYGAARSAMSNWDDQFGYELVPAEMELAFPEFDPQLSTQVARVVNEAVAQRIELLASRGQRGGGFGGAGNRGATGPGGAGRIGSLGGAAATGSPIDHLAASGSGTGSGHAAGGSGSLRDYISATPSAPATPTTSGGSAAAPTDATATSAGQGVAARGQDAGAGYPPGVVDNPPGAVSNQQGVVHEALPPQPPLAANSSRGVADSARGVADSTTGGVGVAETSDSAAAGLSRNNPSSNDQSSSNQSSSGQRPAGDATSSRSSSPATTAADNGSSAVGEACDDWPEAAGSSADDGDDAGTGGVPAVGGASPFPSAGGGASSSGGAPHPAAAMSPGLSSELPPIRQVGKDWALPPHISSSRGTEMLRVIRVECLGDRFRLIGEGGRGTPQEFIIQGSDVHSAALQLATAVRERASHWGAAMQGARWQPLLEVAVAADPVADLRYRQLADLLDGSGLLLQPVRAR